MAGAKILVIEDNPSEVFLLRRALSSVTQGHDFEVENLADGEDALEFIRDHWKKCQDFQPCMILLDLHLPKHDGIEILQAVRDDAALTKIPVVVMTNAASPKEAEELQKLGAEYRLKPKNLAEFAKLAADLIEICNGSEVIA